MAEKRNTVRKKMSNRDYANLLYYFETGEFEADLSEYDSATLAHTEIRVMRLSVEEKKKMDDFFKNKPAGSSFKAFLDTMPKATGYFQGVAVKPSVEPKVTQPEDDEPEMLLPGEQPKLKNLPHWIKDHAAKIDPSNIDAAEIVRMLEAGEETLDKMRETLLSMGGSDHPERLLAADPTMFEESLDDRYRYSVVFDDVLEIAVKKYANYVQIMTEEPPSEEENFDRYLTYVLSNACPAKHADMYKLSSNADEVTSIAGNKIVFDNNDETVLEYENYEDMENDFLNLVYSNKVGKDVQVEIFNKKLTAIKIAQKLYKKYPHGTPDGKKFYHTRKEAFEDGALEL